MRRREQNRIDRYSRSFLSSVRNGCLDESRIYLEKYMWYSRPNGIIDNYFLQHRRHANARQRSFCCIYQWMILQRSEQIADQGPHDNKNGKQVLVVKVQSKIDEIPIWFLAWRCCYNLSARFSDVSSESRRGHLPAYRQRTWCKNNLF